MGCSARPAEARDPGRGGGRARGGWGRSYGRGGTHSGPNSPDSGSTGWSRTRGRDRSSLRNGKLRWWAHLDSNQEPWDYESPALTVELWAQSGTAPWVEDPRSRPHGWWRRGGVHSAPDGQTTVPHDARAHDGKAADTIPSHGNHGNRHATPPERRAQGISVDGEAHGRMTLTQVRQFGIDSASMSRLEEL